MREIFKLLFVIIVPFIFPIYSTIKIYKRYKIYKKIRKVKKHDNLNSKYEYYREIPNIQSTAAGVAFLVAPDIYISRYKMIQAIILELDIKGFIEIKEDENKKRIIKILNKNEKELKMTQYMLLNFIRRMANNKDEISIIKLRQEIMKHPEDYERTCRSIYHYGEKEQIEIRNFTKNKEEAAESLYKDSLKLIGNAGIIGFFSMMNIIIGGSALETNRITGIFSLNIGIIMLIVLIWIIIFSVNVIRIVDEDYLKDGKEEKKIWLTKNGKEEKEKWIGFKNYLKDYTLIEEYEIESKVINKEYLIYATLFGIANEIETDLGKYEPLIMD